MKKSTINRNRKVTKLSIERKRKILEFIGQFCKENKYCPNIREIGIAGKISSTSVVMYYIHKLQFEGLVDFVAGQARTIHLTEQGELSIAYSVKLEPVKKHAHIIK